MYDEQRKGTWADKTMAFTLSEYAGQVTPYSDFTENVSSDVNFEFPERDNYVFETVIKYGAREMDVAAKAKLNLVSEKQQSAAFIMAEAHNRINLKGVAGKRVYGMLNDPNLPVSLSPITVNSKTTWADKKADNPSTFPQVVFNDIQKMWADLKSRNGGHVKETDAIVLAIAPGSSADLIVPNQYGLSAKTMLDRTFPKLSIVELPELATLSGNMMFMAIPTVLGKPTAYFAYSEKARYMNVFPKLSSYQQKVAGSTFGCVYTRTSLVTTMTGI